ncbi:hypothetical protein ABZ897_43225 [Nonomuraea sp. NPDC046802]|uniref:hypothetical protein n=1 Tax=Nonomuraea sp. NPDC046802 TaxID=3154919 RepID=UPI0033EFCC58
MPLEQLANRPAEIASCDERAEADRGERRRCSFQDTASPSPAPPRRDASALLLASMMA